MGKRKKTKSGAVRPVPKLGLYGGLQLFLFVAGCGLFAVVTLGMILSTRIFHRHGVLAAVDAPARTLAVHNKPTGQWLTYTWNESTEFLEGQKRVPPEALVRGEKVVVYYRGGFFTPHTAVRVKLAARAENADDK